jgi:hypothetical protein
MLWLAIKTGSLKIIRVKALVDTLLFHQFAIEEGTRMN